MPKARAGTEEEDSRPKKLPKGAELLTVDGREVTVTNAQKVLFPEAGHTKLDLVQYYLAVAEGALRGAGGRPNVLVRYPNGVGQEFFYQKRAPESRPEWIEVVALKFPSGRTAEEIVPRDSAALAWMANLACLELHPHPVRAEELDHPDELRVDLDPVPGVEWPQIQKVARVVEETLADLDLVGWIKTSGSRGMHVIVRIEQRWTFPEVRRAALAFAREVERRAPTLATSKWWKEERHGVFLDYNQNAKDRTVASAYSVRPRPDARVSAPIDWNELDACNPADFTLVTMPARFAKVGDRHKGIDDAVCSLDKLLELSGKHEKEGMGDAPWPPHYKKQEGEPSRVCSRRVQGRNRQRGSRDVSRNTRCWKSAGRRRRKTRWRAWSDGRNDTLTLRNSSSLPMYWWTRCAGDSRRGRESGSTSSTCRRKCARPRSRWILTRIPFRTPGGNARQALRIHVQVPDEKTFASS